MDYLCWLQRVLEAREIPADHLALSLDWLAEFYASRMANPEADIVVATLHHARTRFLDQRESEPATYKDLPEPWPECDAFQSALLDGNRRSAWSLIERRLEQNQSVVDVELHMSQPALYGIGQKWQENQVSVAQEHLATAIAQSLMTQGLLRSDALPSNGRTIVLACVAGNHHSMGLQMVADAFQLEGWDVQFLGANVPTEVLIRHLGQHAPNLLGLSVSFAQGLRVVKEIMAKLGESLGAGRPAVIIGGLAINRFAPIAGRLGADSWGSNARSAVAAASALALQAPGE